MLQVRVILDDDDVVDDLRAVFPSLLMLFAVSVCFAALSLYSVTMPIVLMFVLLIVAVRRECDGFSTCI